MDTKIILCLNSWWLCWKVRWSTHNRLTAFEPILYIRIKMIFAREIFMLIFPLKHIIDMLFYLILRVAFCSSIYISSSNNSPYSGDFDFFSDPILIIYIVLQWCFKKNLILLQQDLYVYCLNVIRKRRDKLIKYSSRIISIFSSE